MNPVKKCLEYAIAQVDNGNFFREPMKWFYMVNGLSAFILPLLFVVFLCMQGSSILSGYGTWTQITTGLSLFLVLCWLFVVAYIVFSYWKNRAAHLSRIARKGNQFVAIPVWAHYVQCNGEAFVLSLVLSIFGSYSFLYVLSLINGFSFWGDPDFANFLVFAVCGILLLIVIAFVLFLICYPILLITHIIGEKLRIKAQIANDLSDVSDIHRAAVLTTEV